MALPVTIAMIVIVGILGAVRWFLKRVSAANTERVAQQIIDAAKKRESGIDAQEDKTPVPRTEEQIRQALKAGK